MLFIICSQWEGKLLKKKMGQGMGEQERILVLFTPISQSQE